jgi:predicted kinase
MRERARQRESVSDADAAVYLRQRADFTPLDEIAPQCRCVADTTRALEEIVAMVEERLANLCGSEENRA